MLKYMYMMIKRTSDGHGTHKRDSGTSSKLDEEDVDEHYKTLTNKHGDTYSVPQLRLWARTLHCGTHDSYEPPPSIAHVWTST